MVDVVFDDSHKGCLIQCAKQSEKNLLNPDTIFQIGFQLDIGDITNPNDASRKVLMDSLWGSFSNDENAFDEYQELLRLDMEKLLSFAKKKEALRIWTSNAPHELCGLYYTCFLVRDFHCPIYVVTLPEYIETAQHALIYYHHWQAVTPEYHFTLLKTQRLLTFMEIQQYANQWQALMDEHATLRANVNGTLISVPDNFYDSIIQRFIPDTPFPTAYLIGTILNNALPALSDSFLAARIDKMIEAGYLEVLKEDGTQPYSKLLQKKNG